MTTPLLHSDSLNEPSIHRSFLGHTGAVQSVSFRSFSDVTASTITGLSTQARSRRHHLSDQLASGGADNLVLVWTWHPALRCYRLVGHRAAVTGVRYSPDGNLLASASKDCTVRVWHPTPEGRSLIIQPHMAAVNSVCWASDGQRILTASDDQTAKIWRLTAFPEGNSGPPGSGAYESSLVGHTGAVLSAEFALDGRAAVSGGADFAAKLWDCSKSACLRTYLEHSGSVNAVSWHPLGNTFASAGSDGAVKLFDSRSHQLIQHYSAHDSACNAISFHPSGNYLLSSGSDFTSRVWDLRAGTQRFALHGHEEQSPILAAAFSPCGNLFATGGADQRTNSWFFKPGDEASDQDIFRRSKSFASSSSVSSSAQPGKFVRNLVKPSKRDQLYSSKSFAKAKNPTPNDILYSQPSAVVSGARKSASVKGRPNSAKSPAKAGEKLKNTDFVLPGADKLEEKYECNYSHSHTGMAGGQKFEYSVNGVRKEAQSEAAEEKKGADAPYQSDAEAAAAHSYPHATTLSSNLRPASDPSHRPAMKAVPRLDAAIALEGRNRKSKAAAAIVAVRPSDHVSRIPDELSHALSTIVTRLDFIGKTLMAFDSRLEMQENKIQRFSELESVREATKFMENKEKREQKYPSK